MSETAFLNKVYDLLVEVGGASIHDKSYFITAHMRNPPCDEYRFQGKLGFGGKYRSKTNRVDCYPEDETKERREIMSLLNGELAKLVLRSTLCSPKTG